VCRHQAFNAQQGIICTFTSRQADFEGSCSVFESISGKEDHSTPYDYPATLFDVEARRASTGRRFANYIIDTIMVYALVFLTGVGMAVFSEIMSPGFIETLDDSSSGFTLFSYLLGFTVFFIYYACMEAMFGRTIGKLITGTYVVDKHGRQPSLYTIAMRTLSRFVPFEAFSFLADSRGWHDRWTDSWVVQKE
jgi:uncharacterized RDD family membrane protein YckC